MRIVVYHKDPGHPDRWKYKFLEWFQYDLPKLSIVLGLVSLGILSAGFLLDLSYSTLEVDYVWFQRSGAVVVGWSLFLGMLERAMASHRSELMNAPALPGLDLQPIINEKRAQAFRLSIIEAASLFVGTLVWAFGDMITYHALHCGQWMCR
jgi:hypothetical protein